MEGQTVFAVEKEELDYIRGKVEKLNRRAAKIGCAPIVLTVLKEEEVIVKKNASDNIPEDYAKVVVTIDLRGEPPKIAGWTFVATVEPTDIEGGDEPVNIINKMPGVTYDVPIEYRHASMFQCDHCHTKRQRNEVFVIRHENGEFKIVGRQCIKDFMGYNASPNELVRMAQDYANLVGEIRAGFGGNYGEPTCNLQEYLFRTAYFVRKFGYSRGDDEDEYGMHRQATKWAVWGTFWIDGDYRRPESKRENPFYGFFRNTDGTEPINFGMTINPKYGKHMSDQEYADAKAYYDAAKAYICELVGGEEDELNDYLYNVRVIMQMRYIKRQHAGYAASVVRVYQKHLGDEEKRRQREQSEFQGVVGQKLTIPDVKLVNARGFESTYGWSEILTFSDKTGNYYKWFTNTRAKLNLNVGDTVAIAATVKKHDEYNGAKSTVITRAKITPII